MNASHIKMEGEVRPKETTASVSQVREKGLQTFAAPPVLPTLPPELWAQILTDHLLFQDIMQCAVVSPFFLHEVMPVMTSLSIQHTRELHVAQARRFPLVKTIQISSYLKPIKLSTTRPTKVAFCNETAERLVPFLSQFHRLVKVSMRAMYPKIGSGSTTCIRFVRDEENLAAQRALMQTCCGGFATGALSPKLCLSTVVCPCLGKSGEGGCNGLCQRICRHFPMVWVLSQAHHFGLCIDKERFAILAKRPGGREYLSRHENICALFAKPGFKLDEVYCKKYKTILFRYKTVVFEEVALLRDEYGCNPTKVEQQKLLDVLPPPEYGIVEETLKQLVGMGCSIPAGYWSRVVSMSEYNAAKIAATLN